MWQSPPLTSYSSQPIETPEWSKTDWIFACPLCRLVPPREQSPSDTLSEALRTWMEPTATVESWLSVTDPYSRLQAATAPTIRRSLGQRIIRLHPLLSPLTWQSKVTRSTSHVDVFKNCKLPSLHL